MSAYRLERSSDAGASWGVADLIPHPVPCVSPVTFQYGAYLAPGTKLFRLFSGDIVGNWSQPSDVVSVVVKPPLIGNPGGQTEQPLPPSPFIPSQPAPPPPVVRPGKLSGFQVANIGPTSATVTFPLPAGTGADVRLSLDPIAWGGATSLSCVAGSCSLANLLPNHVYALQGIYYFGILNQGAIYGELSDVWTFTTAPFVPPIPPIPPDPPDSAVMVADALDAAALRCKQAKSCSGKTFANYLLEELRKVKP